MLYQTVLFGSSKAGLSTVGYRLYNGDGTPAGSHITSGIQDLAGGQYGAIVEVPDDFVGRITWDTGEVSNVYASAELNTPDNEAIVDAAVEAVISAVQTTFDNIIVRPNDRVVVGAADPQALAVRLPQPESPRGETLPAIPQTVRNGIRRPTR